MGAARTLWLETHPLPTSQDKMGTDGATSVATDQSKAKRGRPVANGVRITKQSQLSRFRVVCYEQAHGYLVRDLEFIQVIASKDQ
jgi:hypothetical protein